MRHKKCYNQKNKKMKIKNLVIAAMLFVTSVSSGYSVVTANFGDLVAAFYEPTGTAAGANTYVINLGSAANMREGNLSVNIDINDDLATAFGVDWANTNSVRMVVVGVVGSTSPVINGDPARTTYLSRDNNGLEGSASTFTLTSSNRGTASTQLTGVFTPLQAGINENGAVDGGAIYATSAPNSVTTYLSPTASTNFGLGLVPYVSINNADAGLDIFRTLHTTVDADLTVAATPGASTVGQSQYVGSVKLSTNGIISVNPVPEPGSAMLSMLAILGVFRRRR
jgi:hypothetical protein